VPAHPCECGRRPTPGQWGRYCGLLAPEDLRDSLETSTGTPAFFTTAPSGASEPQRMVMPPVGAMACLEARTRTPSGSGGAMSARFSAIVLPVTVRQSPCSRPASSKARGESAGCTSHRSAPLSAPVADAAGCPPIRASDLLAMARGRIGRAPPRKPWAASLAPHSRAAPYQGHG